MWQVMDVIAPQGLPCPQRGLQPAHKRRGMWQVMDAIAPQGLSRPQRGLQPACKNRGKGFSPHRAQPKPDLKPETET